MYKDKKKTADMRVFFFFYKTNDFSCFLIRNHFMCSFCSQVFLLQYLAKKHHKQQVTLDRLIRQ